MAFDVTADAYDSFMGRYSDQLTPQMVEFARVRRGDRVLDVGCGPGALTAALLDRGAKVSAVDPSPQFVEAAHERYRDADVRQAAAESLPFADGMFDAALAQLVVHFMEDPVRGIGEMARVTRNGGVVAACTWDLAGGQSPISPLWRAARELDPDVQGEANRPGTAEGQLTEIFTQAGLAEIEEITLPVRVEHPAFDEWWLPFTLGVGPAGAYYQQLEPERQHALEQRLREQLPPPVRIRARAWAARGVVAY